MMFHLDIEWICLREFIRLTRRHRRYLGLVLPMYGRTLHSLGRSQMLRAAYCLARLLDDVLDGDCPVCEEPAAYVQRILSQARLRRFTTENVATRLAGFVFQHVDSFAAREDAPLQELISLIEAMLFDRERACQRLLLTQDALQGQHQRTFAAALNVTLCIVGAYTRAPDVPALIQAQGCLYTLRDLDVDLGRGLINIPLDVVEAALRQGADSYAYEALRRTPAVQSWLHDELVRGVRCVARAGGTLATNRDRRATMVLRPLYRGLYRLAQRLTQQLFLPQAIPTSLPLRGGMP
jgi:hypothetical protein